MLLAFNGSESRADPIRDGVQAYMKADFDKVDALWRPLADKGDVRAQKFLVALEFASMWPKVNDPDIVRWAKEAADTGDGEAQLYLSRLYRDGRGVPKDAVKSLHWLEKSAATGFHEGLRAMGNHILDNLSSTEDLKRAVSFFSKAADAGNVKAMYQLQAALLYGLGIEPDPSRAKVIGKRAWTSGFQKKHINNNWSGTVDQFDAVTILEGLVDHYHTAVLKVLRQRGEQGDALALPYAILVEYFQGVNSGTIEAEVEVERRLKSLALSGNADAVMPMNSMADPAGAQGEEKTFLANYRLMRKFASQGHLNSQSAFSVNLSMSPQHGPEMNIAQRASVIFEAVMWGVVTGLRGGEIAFVYRDGSDVQVAKAFKPPRGSLKQEIEACFLSQFKKCYSAFPDQN